MSESPASPESDLVDLTDLPLSELLRLDGTVLAHSLRRVVDEVENSGAVIAGFQSVLPAPDR